LLQNVAGSNINFFALEGVGTATTSKSDGLFYFMNRDFKGVWVPREVWLDEKLSWMEKLFLVEIDSLDNENGCFASNKYFGEFFGLSNSRVSEIISSLQYKGYITSFLLMEGKEVKQRTLSLIQPIRKSEGGIRNSEGGYSEKAKDNNTLINNTSILNNKLYNDKNAFINRVDELKDKLGNQYESFISYWTEANEKGKMRYQDQKFFDISRRIATWVKNSKNFQPTTTQTTKIKLK